MPRKLIKLLIVSVQYGESSTGGAAKSFKNIFLGLTSNKNFELKILSRTSSKLMQKLLDPLGISYFFFLFEIIKMIKKVKPSIIITQSRIAFAATLAAKITRVPIITLIRDVSDICPKHIDVIDYGKACEGLRNRKTCYNCINYWRPLRVLIRNKTKEWQSSYNALFSSIIYKLRYFSCRLNLRLLNFAHKVVVSSNLMKNILSEYIEPQKITIINITPIVRKPIIKPPIKKKQLLFIISSYGGSHKGLDFVLRLSKLIPSEYKVLIVGNKLPNDILNSFHDNIINLNQVSRSELDKIYQKSQITLVPSFWNEAFGRIIIESIVNRTPVISSPNCGANSFFFDKGFLRVVPIHIQLWAKEVKDLLDRNYIITDKEINDIYHQFSIEKSEKDFSKLIYKVLSEAKK